MRRVTRNWQQKPAILTKQTTVDILTKLINTGDKNLISSRIYQDPYTDVEGKTQSSIRDALNTFYHGKCAYCETDCKAEIEHYRPKQGVREDAAHSGYYWLCYEWSNLIPSCHDCNTAGGKGTQFPVAGVRLMALPMLPGGLPDPTAVVASGAHLLAERPYLLHPELDDPDSYLGAQLDPKGEGVRLTGLDLPTRRGEMTIKITNLNRTSLKVNRLRTLETFVKAIHAVFTVLLSLNLVQKKIEESLMVVFSQMDADARSERAQHTLVLRQAIQTEVEFSALVVPLLETEAQPIVQAAFAKYRLQHPY